MSRYGKEKGRRHKSSSTVGSKKGSLTALLAVFAMIVGFGLAVSGGLWAAASAADGDTIVPVPPIPDSVTYTDPCGSDNSTWDSLPASIDTDQFDWKFGPEDRPHLLVTDITGYEAFAAGPNTSADGRTYDYGVPPDSNEACPPEPTVIDVPAQPSVNDPCGPDNASWNVPANTDTLHWAVNDNGHLVVTIVADNTKFTDDSTSHDYGVAQDSGVACDNGGDNGTVKTHNVGTPTDDVNDEPKVDCTGFYLDAFGFDGLQQVSWHIDTDTHGDTVLSGTITLDDNGHGFTTKLVLPNGMYKLYWHFDGQNGADKHKVFKVEGDCTPPPPPNTCPPGFTLDDSNGNGIYEPELGETCVMLPPPPKPQCSDGTSPGDVNQDGVANEKDCHPAIVVCRTAQRSTNNGCTPPPKKHHKPTHLPHTGWTTAAVSQHKQGPDSSAFLMLAGGLLLFLAGGTNRSAAIIRRRRDGEG